MDNNKQSKKKSVLQIAGFVLLCIWKGLKWFVGLVASSATWLASFLAQKAGVFWKKIKEIDPAKIITVFWVISVFLVVSATVLAISHFFGILAGGLTVLLVIAISFFGKALCSWSKKRVRVWNLKLRWWLRGWRGIDWKTTTTDSAQTIWKGLKWFVGLVASSATWLASFLARLPKPIWERRKWFWQKVVWRKTTGVAVGIITLCALAVGSAFLIGHKVISRSSEMVTTEKVEALETPTATVSEPKEEHQQPVFWKGLEENVLEPTQEFWGDWWLVLVISLGASLVLLLVIVVVRKAGWISRLGGGFRMPRSEKVGTALLVVLGLGVVQAVLTYYSPTFRGWWEEHLVLMVVNSAVAALAIFLMIAFGHIRKVRLLVAWPLIAIVAIGGIWPLLSPVLAEAVPERDRPREARMAAQEVEPRQTGILSWEMPPGMVNLLYPDKPETRYFRGRVEILRNDKEVLEFITYSRYGGVLARNLWIKSEKFGRCWSEGNSSGRKSDTSEWYLEPTGPGKYRGAWRNQAQTGNRWVPMTLEIR